MPQNMLVILTDDQRWDTLWAMPLVQATLVQRGVHFTQAVVSTPICCPSRASFLSGGRYAHNTRVLTNSPPWGGASLFDDTDTLATRLQGAGYATALIGKYLNKYDPGTLAIPPGWSRFLTKYRGSWTQFTTMRGSSTAFGGVGQVEVPPAQYMTDYLRDEAMMFLHSVGEQPFFLLFAPAAPHAPATPAPGDEALFSDYVYRERDYSDGNVWLKPAHMQNQPMWDEAVNDEFHRNQLRSLQAVDRAVAQIVETLETMGKLDNTVIVYMSDNGYQWGEHMLTHKGAPYEESVRVPLIVVAPGIAPRADKNLAVANLDIPATAMALAGLPPQGDGIDLLPQLANPALRLRPQGAFLEAYRMGGIPTTWAGWRTREYKYVEHDTGEVELYALRIDPYETTNVADLGEYGDVRARMAVRVARFRRFDLGAPPEMAVDDDEDE